MWALVTKNGDAKPLSHRFAALWEPIWGLCGFIGQFQRSHSRKLVFPALPIFGNPAYLTREGRSAVAKARRVLGSTTSTSVRIKPMVCNAIRALSPPGSTITSPDAFKRRLTTQTTMVNHKRHVF